MFSIFIAFILLGAGAFIAVANNAYVDISVFGVLYNQSISAVILISMLFGFIAGVITTLPIIITKSIQYGSVRKALREYQIKEEADKDVVYRSAGLGQDGDNII